MTDGAIVCFGEMLLRLATPAGHPFADTQSLEVVVGGAEVNVGVALSALDWPCRMATALPDNPLGDRALSALLASGIDTRGVVRGPGRMGLYMLETGASLRASRVTYDRAGSTFATIAPDRFDFDTLMDGARLLHLSGITAALGPNGLALAQAAMAAARRVGVPISFDPNYRETLWNAWDSDPRAALHGLMAEADILFAGHRDVALLTGRAFSGDGPERRREAAEAAFALFPRLRLMASTARQTVSQSHHRLAARVDTRDACHQTQALDITDIVDRIGTGDAFAAGVLHGRLVGHDLATMAQTGLALGALKHAIPGDFCRISPAELAAFTGQGGDVSR